MKTSHAAVLTASLLGALAAGACAPAKDAAAPAPAPSGAAQAIDRTVLPIPKPVPALVTEPDVRKAQMPPRQELTAPQGAPNVLLVLIDDMGFGQPAAFGGPINMPTLDQLG